MNGKKVILPVWHEVDFEDVRQYSPTLADKLAVTQALGFYSMIFRMPQFVKTLSSQYSNTTVGLLVMIPYLVVLLGCQ